MTLYRENLAPQAFARMPRGRCGYRLAGGARVSQGSGRDRRPAGACAVERGRARRAAGGRPPWLEPPGHASRVVADSRRGRPRGPRRRGGRLRPPRRGAGRRRGAGPRPRPVAHPHRVGRGRRSATRPGRLSAPGHVDPPVHARPWTGRPLPGQLPVHRLHVQPQLVLRGLADPRQQRHGRPRPFRPGRTGPRHRQPRPSLRRTGTSNHPPSPVRRAGRTAGRIAGPATVGDTSSRWASTGAGLDGSRQERA